jgi:hypothetical protein
MKNLIALVLSLTAITAQSRELPAWQQLEFEQKAFWVSARSKLSVAAIADNGSVPRWRLRAESSVASNLESIAIDFDADSGRVIHRGRYSQGKNSRYKEYQYRTDAVTRLRREPPEADSTELPGDWPITSKRELSLPTLPDGSVISSPLLLLLLAGDALAAPDAEARFFVHTDFNFYQVTARMTGTEELEVKTPAGTIPAAGRHLANVVSLEIRPLGTLTDKSDFMLLGLSDDISILYDASNHLPLQLRGRAPRIGRTRIELKSAVFRATQP